MERRILILDDEEAILFAMREFFTAQGYEVDCARELEEAQALVSNFLYCAVVADLRLTGSHSSEGLEMIAFVKARCPETKALLLTAYGSSEVEEAARRRGVDAFLHKPQPLAEVARLLLTLMGRAS